MFKGELIFLRPIEKSDATKVVIWENDIRNWRVTGTEAPFSLGTILTYIESIQNVRQSGELRLIICRNIDNEPVGAIDLNNINFRHEHADVGILIGTEEERGKGYALEALNLLIDYAHGILGMYNLHASILDDNIASIHLFEKAGFQLIGKRKDWFKEGNKRVDERIYQLCIEKRREVI